MSPPAVEIVQSNLVEFVIPIGSILSIISLGSKSLRSAIESLISEFSTSSKIACQTSLYSGSLLFFSLK